MNLLLIGGGGREHALAWKLRQSPLLDRLYCAPGNAGIEAVADCVALDVADHAAVIGFCRENDIGLVVIGPEAPLVAGLADDLEAAGIKVFGPSRAAAAARRLQRLHQGSLRRIRHPHGGLSPLRRRVRRQGLCGHAEPAHRRQGRRARRRQGRGHRRRRARQRTSAIDDCFGGAFGAAGAEVVIEEFLDGEEASFFALVDGETALPLATAQDHKRAFDGDQGPNTGGMGAYSPAPIMTPALCAQVMERDHPADGAGDAGARHAVQGRALCRADAQERRGEADRIQCALRRSRDAGADAAAQIGSAACPARRGRRALKRRRARLARRCRALRGDGDTRLSRRLTRRARRSKGSMRPAPTRMCRCSMPAPSARAGASSPMAAACSASPRGARTFARRRPAPMRRSTRSIGLAASAAATSAGARCGGRS